LESQLPFCRALAKKEVAAKWRAAPVSLPRFQHTGGFMKNLRPFLFAFAALFMATAAQAQHENVKANVPFDFVVGDRAYPAGEYYDYVRSMDQNDVVLRIDNSEATTSGFVHSNPCRGIEPATTTKLVFHRVGDSYFLYQIWTEGHSGGRQFPISRREIQISQYREKPEAVIVAARIVN
jgi:hypothetical protein